MHRWMGECLQRSPKSLGALVDTVIARAAPPCLLLSLVSRLSRGSLCSDPGLCLLSSSFGAQGLAPLHSAGKAGKCLDKKEAEFFTDQGKLREVGEACVSLKYHICTRLRASCDKPQHQQVWLPEAWIHTSPPCFLLR